MANVKNFGLIGVGSDVQYGKAGPRLKHSAGTFNFKAADGSTDSALTAAGITSSAGNITLTTGNLVASSSAATLSIGGDTTLSRQQAGVFQLGGSGGVVVPSGTVAQRPGTPVAGMFRFNDDADVMEYYTGSAWSSLATGGAAVTAVSVATSNGLAGTSSGGTTPELTLSTTVTGIMVGNGSAISAAVSGTDIKTVGGLTILGSGDVGTIGVPYGGTGATSLTGYVKGSGTTALTASATIPTTDLSGTISLTTQVDGILPVANGGTGVSTLTTNGIVFGNGTSAVGSTAAGTQYQVLQAGSGGVPEFGALALDQAAAVSGILSPANGGTGVDNGTNTVTLAGNFATSGANNITLTSTGTTNLTLPTSGTLLVDGDIGTSVQGYDAGLAALAAKTSTGILVQTGADTYTSVSLVAPAAGITISNADGTAGSPTFALANDLAAVEGLSSNGYAVRTADGAWTTRQINGFAGRTVVTNGDGVSSNTDIDLATVTDTAVGTFLKITRDVYGRVEGTTPVVAADITGLVDSTYVNVAGDTMTGSLVMSGGTHITIPDAPVNDTDAANKAYVDAVAAGLSWKQAVDAATTGNITLSGTQTVDGVVLLAGDRVLVKDQTDPAENGIYVVAAGAWVRSTDMDVAGEFLGATVFVLNGTANDNSGWTQTETVVTVDTDPVLWQQFSGSSTYVWGIGLEATGNVININLGAGIKELPSDEVGIDLYDTAGGALWLTSDGINKTTDTGAGLYLKLATGGGLTQDSTGLYIAATGVTNAMLANDSISFNTDSGTVESALGETLLIAGTSAQGIHTSAAGSTVTITADDASDSQKGVASFDATEFSVSSGNVNIGLIGATKGGTGFSSYTTGDILFASSSTALSKLAVGGAGTVLKGGVTPTYGAVDLTTDVTGILPPANGGTGVANSNTITLGGDISTAGAFTTSGAFDLTLTTTGATNITLPTSGTLATVGNTVASFSGGATGLTPSSATTGAITLGGTLVVANGGTGASTFTAGRLLLGDGTNPITEDADLAFNAGTNALTIGSALITGTAGDDVTITATGTNADINLVPNGTGSVVIGPSGGGFIQSDAGQPLTVQGNTSLTLTSIIGDTTLAVPVGSNVTVTGPTAAGYAGTLTDSDLVNKYYVDQVAGNISGDVKAVKATLDLSVATPQNIGAALPAGATILSVKVNVTSAAATGELQVGKAGSDQYMTTAENDTQTVGMYLAETMVTEAGSVQVQGTVTGTAAAGSATVVVTYQIA